MKQTEVIELRLKGKSYQELEVEMSVLSTDALLALLGSKSRKIGDTASSLLNRKNERDTLAEAILKGTYKRRDAKVRAANTLWFGKANSELADDALLYLVQDKSEEIAGNALFALVALRRVRVVEKLGQIKQTARVSPEVKEKIDLAVEAIQKQDPRIYNPYYGG